MRTKTLLLSVLVCCDLRHCFWTDERRCIFRRLFDVGPGDGHIGFEARQFIGGFAEEALHAVRRRLEILVLEYALDVFDEGGGVVVPVPPHAVLGEGVPFHGHLNSFGGLRSDAEQCRIVHFKLVNTIDRVKS